MSDVDPADREWWQTCWSEREKVLENAYGMSGPPGSDEPVVLPLPDPLRELFPGACVQLFHPEGTGEWLFVTHGPSQPRSPAAARALPVSGSGNRFTGFEYAIAVAEDSLDDATLSWAANALCQILQYSTIAKPTLDRGHRVGFSFLDGESGLEAQLVGPADLEEDAPRRHGEIAGLLLWTTLQPWKGFETSLGGFHLLVATAITEDEWARAKETSSVHLLYMLHLGGVGQRSDPDRRSVFAADGAQDAWARIAALSEEEAFEQLYSLFARDLAAP